MQPLLAIAFQAHLRSLGDRASSRRKRGPSGPGSPPNPPTATLILWPKATGEFQRMGKLIGLHPDQTNQPLIAVAS